MFLLSYLVSSSLESPISYNIHSFILSSLRSLIQYMVLKVQLNKKVSSGVWEKDIFCHNVEEEDDDEK
jgi:hypothetical protein